MVQLVLSWGGGGGDGGGGKKEERGEFGREGRLVYTGSFKMSTPHIYTYLDFSGKFSKFLEHALCLVTHVVSL